MTPTLALLLALPGQYPDWRPDPDRDLAQFPPFAVAYDSAEFAVEHCRLVAELVKVNGEFAWLNADSRFWLPYQREAQRRRDVWQVLQFSTDPANSQFARECWTVQLHGMLGAKKFWRGKMPAPAPILDDLWRR